MGSMGHHTPAWLKGGDKGLLGMVLLRGHKEPFLRCVDSLPSPQGPQGSSLMLGWGNVELG